MSAPDGLFAAKGKAEPVDQTHSARDVSTEPEAGVSTAANSETTPLPDLFGEPANDEGTKTPPDADGNTGNAEPPPAASLLTIVSQRSAARRRRVSPDTSDATPPETFVKADDDVPEALPDTAGDDATQPNPGTTNLPVPVRVQLPMVTGSPVAGKSRWDQRMAALAACVAISIAGAVSILIAAYADDTVATAGGNTPTSVATTIPVDTLSVGAAPAQTPDTATGVATDAPVAEPPATVQAGDLQQPKTTIGSVRIDLNGRAIVSGQAPPEAELIVLHNRLPLGTARSDAAGIWTFAARVPVRANRNEISIVPMRIDNSVLVTDLPAVPRPGRRPVVPSYYFAQIASLPSAADAGREAAKLAAKLAGIVATDQISVRVATIESGRKVYRVAIGGFPTKAGATDICTRIRAANTSCLVMEGS